MSASDLHKRVARLEQQPDEPERAALFLLEDEDDALPAWAATAPIRAVLDLREPRQSTAQADRDEVAE